MPSDESVTLCAIMKDERPYIVEWAAYHRMLGFDHIVVYTNDCSDGSEQLLNMLSATGLLEHRSWPSAEHTSPQQAAYADALPRCKTEWICFLDADEFFNPKKTDTVGDFLRPFKNDVSAIAINWRIFGSAGELVQRPGLVMERFTRASPSEIYVNRHCKTMARVQDIQAMYIHCCSLARGRFVDTHGQDIAIERLGFTPSVQHETAQINHYVLKSAEEFQHKRNRGNANLGSASVHKYTSRYGDFFLTHDRNEQSEDSILRFLPSFKQDIARYQLLELVE